ncbi:MAG: ABC transporter permease, partial [bacterium]|nr:ABC transporter permease [bacterium]
MKYVYLIWRNLMRKKIRAVLTLASIFVAFVLYGALVAIKTGFSGGVELAGLDRMVTIHKVSLIMPLPMSYMNKILAVDGVADVAHGNWFGGVYQEPKNFFAQIAVGAEGYLRIYPEIRLPEEQKQAWLRNRMGAIVGRSTANRFGWKVGDRIPIRGVIWRTRDGSPW